MASANTPLRSSAATQSAPVAPVTPKLHLEKLERSKTELPASTKGTWEGERYSPMWRMKAEDPHTPRGTEISKPIRFGSVLWELYIEMAFGLFAGWTIKVAITHTITYFLVGEPVRYDNEEVHATLASETHPFVDSAILVGFVLVASVLTMFIDRVMPGPVALKVVFIETVFCVPMWSLKHLLSNSIDTIAERSYEDRIIIDIVILVVLVLLAIGQIFVESKALDSLFSRYSTEAPETTKKPEQEANQQSRRAPPQNDEESATVQQQASGSSQPFHSPHEDEVPQSAQSQQQATTTEQPNKDTSYSYKFYFLTTTKLTLAFSIGFVAEGLIYLLPWAGKLWFELLVAIGAIVLIPIIDIIAQRWRKEHRETLHTMTIQGVGFCLLAGDFMVAFFWQSALESILGYFVMWSFWEHVRLACILTLIVTSIMLLIGLIHKYIISVNDLVYQAFLVACALTIAWTWMDFICNTLTTNNVMTLWEMWTITLVAFAIILVIVLIWDLCLFCCGGRSKEPADEAPDEVDSSEYGSVDTSARGKPIVSPRPLTPLDSPRFIS